MLQNKVAIITGGSSGIGKAIARKLAEEGLSVVITGRKKDKLEKAKAEIEQYKDQVLIYPMDVRDPDQVQNMVEKTIDTFGQIDFLVNNAAGNFICPAENLSINGWHAVINIVLHGTWYCSQTVGKHWIANKHPGHILNIVATYAWTAGPGVIHSACAKAGVLAMTRTLAVEWGAKYGIRVNAIAPGPIQNTGGADRLWPTEEQYQKTIQSIPAKRLGKPEEVARLAHFLLSDESNYMNGECVVIDGGQWLNRRSFL
ncbi:2,4-dienoyl-CoA reductase [Thermoflavimicrobium dichotomicum]|uniref:NAD(P)-dependent dehydrogenase, short-chain alcohol dehydrogenase family n=1 Tax=Thermoflavimicrobium dichotomicum TaxID=46223 RepID=A0A1I3SBJ7_9BACL|nr:2,4-dienoyl-CoA reductase [Thermoflavimicrobium dichotomicum]SFJ54911.1 NAD(P)-dependent dehydrogenase, short-chain alcohol dehydrogenase family [Thermoflavimicrobium dichotomicum]